MELAWQSIQLANEKVICSQPSNSKLKWLGRSENGTF